MAVLSFRTDVLHSEEDFDSSVDEIIKLFSIYFPVVRCIMHEKAVLSFKSVVQGTQHILTDERYQAVPSSFSIAVQRNSNFRGYEWNPPSLLFNLKLLSSTFLWYCLLCCTRRFLLLNLSVNEIQLMHSIEIFLAIPYIVLFCGGMETKFTNVIMYS